MEKAKTRKIKKWDEVHGDYEVEISDGTINSEPDEVAGSGPSISRNPMRGIEDMVEQNDNCLDGLINNIQPESSLEAAQFAQDDKKSVLEKLKEQGRMGTPPAKAPERKPVSGCCQERERMEEAGIQSMTAYLIRMALHGYVLSMDLSDLKEILRLLQRTGNNLNQYAKKANETGSIYHEDIEELKETQKEILQEMRKVLDKLTAIM